MQDNAFLKSPILKLLRNFLTVSTRKGSIKFSMSLPDATVPFRNLSGWVIPGRFSRSECATDIMFRKPEYLAPIYDEIIHTAIYTVKPDNIATFLGQRITYNCTKGWQTIISASSERGSSTTWVMCPIKMYDKFGCVLRGESTCNDISTFRVEQEVQHRDGTSDIRKSL